MRRRFVVIAGLPGSGKSTLAQRLAPVLGLPVLDKDDWLEQAFETEGVGNAEWRRRLSRDADAALQKAAHQSEGAIIVSFWHQSGMPADSGTPVDWLATLEAPIVTIHCVCPPELAADRFGRRQRHPGHLDIDRSDSALVQQLRQLAALEAPLVGPSITVQTSEAIDLESLALAVSTALGNT